jgi:hypothetical protein
LQCNEKENVRNESKRYKQRKGNKIESKRYKQTGNLRLASDGMRAEGSEEQKAMSLSARADGSRRREWLTEDDGPHQETKQDGRTDITIDTL